MSNSVAKRSAASEHMLTAGAKGRALMGGTTAMRLAGEEYLPKFPAESADNYKARLGQSWLFNGYRKATRDMTGRVFAKPIELGAGVTPDMVGWSQNIDMQGQDLSTFARKVFEDAISGSAISFIMVDAPTRGDGTTTKTQAKAANLRPFFAHLTVEEVLGWKTETVENVTRLSQFRIMESVTETDPKDEFSEVKTDQVRVLDRTDSGVMVRLFRQVKDEWVQFDEETFTGLSEITVVPFYANRTGFFKAEPLLDDLADVNIAHWQSQSDQRNILHAARVPILHATGRDEEEGAIVISTGQAVTSRDPSAKLEWVEHSGQAIGAGRQDLKDLEFQMETFGLQLLVAKVGGQSATGEALDAAKETTTLSMTADALKDALEQAFLWAGEYAGTPAKVEVVVNKEFGVGSLTAQDVTALASMVNTGLMSRETFLRELARRGFIRDDIDPDEEAELIEAEGGDLMGEPAVPNAD